VLITVFEIDTINERFRGEIKGGKVGWFPNYYVKPEPGPVPEVKFIAEQEKMRKREDEIKKKEEEIKKSAEAKKKEKEDIKRKNTVSPSSSSEKPLEVLEPPIITPMKIPLPFEKPFAKKPENLKKSVENDKKKQEATKDVQKLREEKETKEQKIREEKEAKEQKIREEKEAKDQKVREEKETKEQKIREEKEAKDQKIREEKEAKLKEKEEKEKAVIEEKQKKNRKKKKKKKKDREEREARIKARQEKKKGSKDEIKKPTRPVLKRESTYLKYQIFIDPERVKRQGPMFGVALGQVMFTSYTEFSLPSFILQVINYLQNYLHLEGVFRISGSSKEIHTFKDTLDKGDDIDLTGINPHSVSGLLKLFLRELPDPLLTFALYQDWIDVIIKYDGEGRIKRIIEIVAKLPMTNKLLLTELLRLLGSISQCADVNKMSPANIGIVFGPTLIRKENSEDLMNMNYPCDVVRLMVENHVEILKTTTGAKVTDVEQVTVQIEEPEPDPEEINDQDGSTEETSDATGTADAAE